MMADLSEVVEERHARLNDTPRTAVEPAAFGPVDPQRVLQLVGLNPRDPKAHAVVAVAKRYALDPILGHIEIIPSSRMPYITRDGYLHIAHRSGHLDGMDVTEPQRVGNQWICQASVYRNDMSRPFVYPGRADVAADNGPEMAIARAERRALKRAFDVTLPREFGDGDGRALTASSAPLSAPETDAQPQPIPAPSPQPDEAHRPAQPLDAPGLVDVHLPEPEPEPEPTQRPISNMQRRAIFYMFNQLGVKEDDRDTRLNMYKDIIGRRVDSTNALTMDEAGKIVEHLGALTDARKDEGKHD